MKCSICGRDMIIHMDTPVCTKCDDAVIYELGWVRRDMDNITSISIDNKEK